jgi:hypothetical protein
MSIAAIKSIATEEQLVELLSLPNAADIEWARRLKGDVMVLGAGGKWDHRWRCVPAVPSTLPVLAPGDCRSRFSEKVARELLESQRIETLPAIFWIASRLRSCPFATTSCLWRDASSAPATDRISPSE